MNRKKTNLIIGIVIVCIIISLNINSLSYEIPPKSKLNPKIFDTSFNSIQNGDFETGTNDSWNANLTRPTIDYSYGVSDVLPLVGTYSYHIYGFTDSRTGTLRGFNLEVSQNITLSNPLIFNVSGNVYVNQCYSAEYGAWASIFIKFYNAEDNEIGRINYRFASVYEDRILPWVSGPVIPLFNQLNTWLKFNRNISKDFVDEIGENPLEIKQIELGFHGYAADGSQSGDGDIGYCEVFFDDWFIYDLDWAYKTPIELSSATPETDYQIKVELNELTFNYSEASPDGSDLRFYDLLDNPLNYWIESWDTSGTSIIWVKIPDAGTTSLYMYYGNPGAPSESDGEATFVFFDDFSGSSLNTTKWDSETDTYSTIEMNDGLLDLTCTVTTYHSYGVWAGFSDTTITHGSGYGTTSTNLAWFANNFTNTYAAGSSTATYNVTPFETWFTGEIRWINTSRIEFNNGTDTFAHTTDIPSTALAIKLVARAVDYPAGAHYGAMVTSTATWGQAGHALRLHSWHRYPTDDYNELQCDWVLVRKCAIPEPTPRLGFYKRLITLSPVTPEDNYQVKVQFDLNNFDYSKTNPDGSDLRFYDASDNPLNYWIESWDTSGTSIIWVKVVNAGTSTLHMFYGNPGALSRSNGEATFVFFDDFSGSSLNTTKWDSETDTYSTIEMNDGLLDLTCTVTTYHSYGVWAGFSDTTITHGSGYGTTSTNLAWFANNFTNTYAAGSSTVTYNVTPFETWFTGEIRWINTSRIEFDNGTDTFAHTTDIPSTALAIKLVARAVDYPAGAHYGAMVTSTATWGQAGHALRLHSWHRYPTDDYNEIQCDWVVVRKCTDSEPVTDVSSVVYAAPLPDINSPTIDSPDDIVYLEGVTNNVINWHPADENPLGYVLYINGALQGIYGWTGFNISINVDNLAVGVYDYKIVVFDEARNSEQDIVIVTVYEESYTTTIPTTTPAINPTTTPVINPTTTPATTPFTTTTSPTSQMGAPGITPFLTVNLTILTIVFVTTFYQRKKRLE